MNALECQLKIKMWNNKQDACTQQLGSDYNISFPFNKGAFKIFCLEQNSVANFGTCLEIIGSGLGLRLDADCNKRKNYKFKKITIYLLVFGNHSYL